MVSEMSMYFLSAAAVASIVIVIRFLRMPSLQTIHRLYLVSAVIASVWFINPVLANLFWKGNMRVWYVLDAIDYLGLFVPVLSMLVALSFIKDWKRLPAKYYLFFVEPLIANVMVWTNPLHHLYYQVFAFEPSGLRMGPMSYVSGAYSYVCMGYAMYAIFTFALRTESRLYKSQSWLFGLGTFAPLAVSLATTIGALPLSYAATPLSLVGTMVFHGFAISRLHFLDIKPVATQRVLDWISDCYLVTSETGLVISYNQPFAETFAESFHIRENVYLSDCVREEDVEQKSGVYNLMTAIHSCRDTLSLISYEQTCIRDGEDGRIKSYYIVEVTPLTVSNGLCGFVIIYKDVTRVREGMERLQASQVRLMEQERLASLGQMVGGLAHNLKTPIMSISGGASAIGNLITESRDSLGDDEVTPDDYREIYAEMEDWIGKIRDACAYMSDIITAVKGQASNMATSDDADFSIDEVFKRVSLLMRHELKTGGCTLSFESDFSGDVWLNGDINNLVQVLNNLVSNAIDASRASRAQSIGMRLTREKDMLVIAVTDKGAGVPQQIRKALFKQMVTSKGTMGTGLGIYLSLAVIRAKFEGDMSFEDIPGGGTVFKVFIPMAKARADAAKIAEQSAEANESIPGKGATA